MDVVVLLSPGHTLCSVSWIADNAAFIHGTISVSDSGTVRADFPGADARHLSRSIQRILDSNETRLFTGHDHPLSGRNARWESTVAAQKAGHDEDGFPAARAVQGGSLTMPALILSALQVTIDRNGPMLARTIGAGTCGTVIVR